MPERQCGDHARRGALAKARLRRRDRVLPKLRTLFLVYMLSPLPRRSGWAYCFAHFTPPYQPSPNRSNKGAPGVDGQDFADIEA
jgi:hypothetical protein